VAAQVGNEFGKWETYLDQIKLEKATNDLQSAQQATALVAPVQGGNSFKTPLPTKFDGKKGDPAFTFMAACNNYAL